MFEFQRLLGPDERKIVLQTKRGTAIENGAPQNLTEQHYRRFELLVELYGARWILRRPPAPDYNCAGHVWAARRTCIYEPAAWQTIMADDGYRRTRQPMPDDLVLYADSTVGLLHVGRIVELRPGIDSTSPRIPWVVSKWQDWTGEVMHYEHDVPFHAQGFVVTTEYWTDRPV